MESISAFRMIWGDIEHESGSRDIKSALEMYSFASFVRTLPSDGSNEYERVQYIQRSQD